MLDLITRLRHLAGRLVSAPTPRPVTQLWVVDTAHPQAGAERTATSLSEALDLLRDAVSAIDERTVALFDAGDVTARHTPTPAHPRITILMNDAAGVFPTRPDIQALVRDIVMRGRGAAVDLALAVPACRVHLLATDQHARLTDSVTARA